MKNANFLIALSTAFLVLSCNQPASNNNTSALYQRAETIDNPEMAIQLLVDGNKRFASSIVLTDDLTNTKRKLLTEKGQKPFAAIITCSDSRVPPELIFDQGLGDLFVIRVAGNVIDSVGMGSIQYAVEHLGVPLVVVLGHEHCGAVHATLGGGEFPGSIPSIANRIQPSIDKVKATHPESNHLEELVIEANVEANVDILNRDVLLKHLIEKGKVKTLGAIYQLESGVVDYFDAKPIQNND